MVSFQEDIEICLRILKEGGIILYPTDTVWGIGCDATNPAAVKKVYDLKQRDDQKAMIILVADEREILQYVAATDLELFDYLQQSQRPTTVIYDGAIGLADNLVSRDGSIAIRICNDEFCRHLIRRFKKPVVSTSANISGQPSPRIFKEISRELKQGVDYIVHHRQVDETPAQPSAIIRWRNGQVEIIRE